MRAALELFTRERRARVFFLVLAQSALGTGAGYVALLLIAYDRFESPWAISLVLVADLLPAMVLGPLFGAVADRWSRKRCTVLADVVRAVAFVGVALVDSFVATIGFALMAGAGTGLFTPAALAGLPSLVDRERVTAASSVYGAILDLGYTVGPGLAAVVLLLASPEALLAGNGVTFVLSAVVLARLSFGAAPDRTTQAARTTLMADVRAGLRATAGMAGIRVVLGAATGALFFVGLFNVGELLLVTEELGGSDAAFSTMVAVFGAGFIGGSLLGARGGSPAELRTHFLAGIVLLGVGLAASGLAPTLGVAIFAFGIAGLGNGMMLVYERLLIQGRVADHFIGRVFGIRDALTAWAFAAAFAVGGGLIAAVGIRPVIVAAGAGTALVGMAAAALLGSRSSAELSARRSGVVSAGGPDAFGNWPTGQHRANVVGAREFWLTLMNDLDDRGDDPGVELGSGVRG
jgi:Transmembrane secretion effector